MSLSSASYIAPLVLLNLAFVVVIALRIRQVGWRYWETIFLGAQDFLLYALSVVLMLAMHDSGVLLHWPKWLSAALLAPLAASATVLFREAGFSAHYALTANPVPKPVRSRSWLGWGLFGLAWGFFNAWGVLQGNSVVIEWFFSLYGTIILAGAAAELYKINRTVVKREEK